MRCGVAQLWFWIVFWHWHVFRHVFRHLSCHRTCPTDVLTQLLLAFYLACILTWHSIWNCIWSVRARNELELPVMFRSVCAQLLLALAVTSASVGPHSEDELEEAKGGREGRMDGRSWTFINHLQQETAAAKWEVRLGYIDNSYEGDVEVELPWASFLVQENVRKPLALPGPWLDGLNPAGVHQELRG